MPRRPLPHRPPELFLRIEEPWLSRTSGVGSVEAKCLGGPRRGMLQAGLGGPRTSWGPGQGLVGVSGGGCNKGPQAGGFRD